MSLTAAELVGKWVGRKVLWDAIPGSGIKIEVETADVRRAFGRVDVMIRPMEGHGTGQTWVDSRYLEILALD
jgi:hypothetical protein